MEKHLLFEALKTYNTNKVNQGIDRKLNKKQYDSDSESDDDGSDCLCFSCPTALSVKNTLTDKKYKYAVEISLKYGEFIENKRWDILRLYEDLCSDNSDLIIYFYQELICINMEWNGIHTKALWLRIVLMQLIEETQPEIQKMMKFEKGQIPKGDQVKNYLTAYGTITVSSALVFTFGVNLASRNLSEDSFEIQPVMYIFHILISISIICCLHALLVTSWVVYNTYRALGGNKIDYAKKYLYTTYNQRNEVRVTFVIGLLTFTLSVSAMNYDGLPVGLACTNTMILLVGLIFIASRIGVISCTCKKTRSPTLLGIYHGPKSIAASEGD